MISAGPFNGLRLAATAAAAAAASAAEGKWLESRGGLPVGVVSLKSAAVKRVTRELSDGSLSGLARSVVADKCFVF